MVVFLGATHNFLFVGINRYHRTDGATKVNRGSVWGTEETCDGQLSHPVGVLEENACSLKSSEMGLNVLSCGRNYCDIFFCSQASLIVICLQPEFQVPESVRFNSECQLIHRLQER